MVPGVYTGYVVALAWISNSLPRPPAKRAAALAFINAISNTSSIYASYMYGANAGKMVPSTPHSSTNQLSAAPRYVVAMSVNCAMATTAMLAALTLRMILVRQNKKLEQGIFVEGAINSGDFRFRI